MKLRAVIGQDCLAIDQSLQSTMVPGSFIGQNMFIPLADIMFGCLCRLIRYFATGTKILFLARLLLSVQSPSPSPHHHVASS
jgi:hypothetical protein